MTKKNSSLNGNNIKNYRYESMKVDFIFTCPYCRHENNWKKEIETGMKSVLETCDTCKGRFVVDYSVTVSTDIKKVEGECNEKSTAP